MDPGVVSPPVSVNGAPPTVSVSGLYASPAPAPAPAPPPVLVEEEPKPFPAWAIALIVILILLIIAGGVFVYQKMKPPAKNVRR
jgi:hypothetical protein